MGITGGLESATVVESRAWFAGMEIASILTLYRRRPTSLFLMIYDETWMRRSFASLCSAFVRAQ